MDTKKTVLQEIVRARSRLEKLGVDISRLSFSYRDDEKEDNEEDPRIPWRAEDTFIKLFTSDLADIVDDLTGSEAFTLFALIPYISYETGMLTIGTTNNKHPITNEDIHHMIKRSESNVTIIMDKLVSKRILSRNKVGRSYQYFANPYIFFKGKFINKTLIAMFRKYAEERRK